jgi:hypothetical protein
MARDDSIDGDRAAHYRAKAEQCRHLASTIPKFGDPAAKGLRDLAAEFEALAVIFDLDDY